MLEFSSGVEFNLHNIFLIFKLLQVQKKEYFLRSEKNRRANRYYIHNVDRSTMLSKTVADAQFIFEYFSI